MLKADLKNGENQNTQYNKKTEFFPRLQSKKLYFTCTLYSFFEYI